MAGASTSQVRIGKAAAMALIGLGWVAAVVAVFVAGLGALSCQLGNQSCSVGARVTITAGLAVAGLAVLVPPAVAIWATRRWVWGVAPAIVAVGILTLDAVSAARHASAVHHEQLVEAGAATLVSDIPTVVGFPAPRVLPPSAPVSELAAAGRAQAEAEIGRMIAASGQLARKGITVGARGPSADVTVTRSGQKFCYWPPRLSAPGAALPGACR